MQLCLHNRKSQWLKNNVRYHCVEQRLIYNHEHGSISWRPGQYTNHSAAQAKNRITPELFTNTAHSYVTKLFVRCQTQQYCNGHQHTQNFVMVIITLKIILNEKVGDHFFQVIPLFWLRQEVVPYKKWIMYKHLWIFLWKTLATPRKK